ncbi:MAG: cell division protein FtsL [Pseudomonadota bacterium]
MNRLSLPIWLIVVLAAGFCMFQIKFAVQELEHQLGRTNRDIQRAQEQIRVLKAEWSYLNEPGRLSDLNRRYLGLAPVAARQMQNFAALPARLDVAVPAPRFDPALPTPAGLAAAANPATIDLAAADALAFDPASGDSAGAAPTGLTPVSLTTADLASFDAVPADLADGDEAPPAGAPATPMIQAPGGDDPLGALIAASIAEGQP